MVNELKKVVFKLRYPIKTKKSAIFAEHQRLNLDKNKNDRFCHTFIDCYPSKYIFCFFEHVLEWFNSEHATSYLLSTEDFLFGKFDNAQLARSDGTLKKLNYCLLFAKYYLYCQNLNKKINKS